MTINFQIGHGYDAHAFKLGNHLVLGGVTISHTMGLKAHSDGDVVIHALIDALLGASSLGDIGQHFPDTNPHWKNKDSRFFLKRIVTILYEKKWRINNVDVIIIAEKPRVSPYYTKIQRNLAQDLKINIKQVGVKSTTTDKLGFIGREEGIAASAIALLQYNRPVVPRVGLEPT